MQDAKALLDSFLGAGPEAQGGGGGLASLLGGPGGFAKGAAVGGLAGLLLGGKKPRKLAKTALKVGGVALVGGLAYKAWRDWEAKKAPPAPAAPHPVETPPSGTAFLPAPGGEEDLSRKLIRAMISAAKADGHITPSERARIGEQLAQLDLPPGDRNFVEEELAKPLDVDAVASSAGSPEEGAEIYAASLLAIDSAGQAEQAYLGLLAARLLLDPDLVKHLHANVDAATDPSAV